MRRWIVFLAIGMLSLGGCLKVKEHLTLEKDGRGVLKVEMLVPSGTSQLIDTMLGGVTQDFSQGFKSKMPKFSAHQMFADKDKFLKQAEAAGLKINFDHFDTSTKEDGLHIDYTISFDDINKLINSGILQSDLEFNNDPEGNLVLSLKEASDKIKNSKVQAQQIEDLKKSDKFVKMDPEIRQAVLDGFKNFQMELFITLPSKIEAVSGVFKQKGPNTAYVSIGGNILDDPAVIKKMSAMSKSTIIFDSQGLSFGVQGKSSRPEKVETLSKIALGSKVKLSLKNGKIVYGTLTQQNQNSVKIDSVGVGLTYYADEISRLEAQP